MRMGYAQTVQGPSTVQGGIVFKCPGQDVSALADVLQNYFKQLGVPAQSYGRTMDEPAGWVQFQLQDAPYSTSTLDLHDKTQWALKEELIELPSGSAKPRTVLTVSKKEILLALLQKGRTTRFSDGACTLAALVDQIGIRQNTVAWAESLSWSWPDGGPARWNSYYWKRGDLKPGRALHQAIMDIFVHPEKYALGCYAATKLMFIQGVLDYYRRIKKDLATASAIEQRLLHDGDPLSYTEPGAAWYFETDVSAADMARPGKLLYLERNIPADNFVPGDWVYFLNTDPVSYEKTGYEGSNTIYLGRGQFSDYYNDHNHRYSYREKLNEVYQWRHGVFSRSRDVAKTKPLSAADIQALGKTPEQGGIQLDYRIVPYPFGFVDLPPMPILSAQPVLPALPAPPTGP